MANNTAPQRDPSYPTADDYAKIIAPIAGFLFLVLVIGGIVYFYFKRKRKSVVATRIEDEARIEEMKNTTAPNLPY